MPRPHVERQTFVVRLPEAIAAQLRATATAEGVSVNTAFERAVTAWLELVASLARHPAQIIPSPVETGMAAAKAVRESAPALVALACPHPKNKRRALGYAVKCDECGQILP